MKSNQEINKEAWRISQETGRDWEVVRIELRRKEEDEANTQTRDQVKDKVEDKELDKIDGFTGYLETLLGKNVSILVDLNSKGDPNLKENYRGIVEKVGKDFISLRMTLGTDTRVRVVVKTYLIISVWEYK